MKRLSPTFPVAVCLVFLSFSATAGFSNPPRPFAPVQTGFTAGAKTATLYASDRVMIKFTHEGFRNSGLRADLAKGAAVERKKTGVASVDAVLLDPGVEKISRSYVVLKDRARSDRLGVHRCFTIELAAGSDVLDAVERFSSNPNIEYATPDWRAFPAVVPTDPVYPDHWGHNNTAQLPEFDWYGTHDHTGPPVGLPGFDARAETAWNASQGFGSASVIIAIVDTGVDLGHADLSLVAGYDYGDDDGNPHDDSASPGHGTGCAGIAAARVNNATGACGAAPGCKIMPLKVANSAGVMTYSAIANAIYHAADNGAHVISMSFGGTTGNDPGTDAALSYAYDLGLTMLAAAGNANDNTIDYPAVNPYVISVGAASPCGGRKRSSSNPGECNPGVQADPNGCTCDGERWWGSNYGIDTPDAANAIDIIGPTILPTTDLTGEAGYRNGDYEPFFNGTSCAAPYVAGVCALLKSAHPSWTPAQIRSQLVSTATDVVNVESGVAWDRYSGYGMVNASDAVGGFPMGTEAADVPPLFDLRQNYPNPFNPVTTIEFSLDRAGHTVLEIFDVTGRRVTTLVDRVLPRGPYRTIWHGGNHPSGVYFARLESGGNTKIRRLVLVR